MAMSSFGDLTAMSGPSLTGQIAADQKPRRLDEGKHGLD